MIKAILSSFFLIGFLLTAGLVTAQQPIEKPVLVQVENLQASQGSIIANIKLTNPNPVSYSNVYYVVKLQGQDVAGVMNQKGKQVPVSLPGSLIKANRACEATPNKHSKQVTIMPSLKPKYLMPFGKTEVTKNGNVRFCCS